jgi:hypothetical protein
VSQVSASARVAARVAAIAHTAPCQANRHMEIVTRPDDNVPATGSWTATPRW